MTHKAARSTDLSALSRASDGLVNDSRPLKPTTSRLVTGFQTGHGFAVVASTAASAVDDTSDYAFGTQSYAVTTKTDNSAATVYHDLPSAVDTTGKNLRILVKVSDIPPTLTELWAYLASDTGYANYYQFTMQPIVQAGEWAWLTLSWADAKVTGSPTRASINSIRLRARSVNGTSVTVRWGGIALTDAETRYTNGVVSLAYDDSTISHWTQARPALNTYGYTGTLYTIVDLVGSSSDYVTVAQLQAMQRDGWEVAAHSYTAADHATGFTGLTSDDLEANLRNMRRWLIDNGFTGGDHIAYPKGLFNDTVIGLTRKYHASARSTINGTETLRPWHPYRMRTIAVNNTTTLASVLAAIDAAKAEKAWLILTFHNLVTSPSIATEFSIANHQAIVDYINSSGMDVAPVGDVLSGKGPAAPGVSSAVQAAITAAAGHPAQVDVFTASGTWTKPSWATTVDVICVGSGGGGGAGRRGAAGTVRCGGGGGGAGSVERATFAPSALTATVAVTVGTGGAGATGQTSDSTDGAGGSNGSAGSSFGTYCQGARGFGGSGGTVSTGLSGSSGNSSVSTAGASASTTGGAGVASSGSAQGASGGGSGGGVTSGDVTSAGGNGVAPIRLNGAFATGGTAGGGAGGSGVAATGYGGGGGGAGGGSNTAGAGGAGGNGGTYGAGGGGGGASLNGNASGAGGNGAGGLVVVISRP